jgi:hypothetical protein
MKPRFQAERTIIPTAGGRSRVFNGKLKIGFGQALQSEGQVSLICRGVSDSRVEDREMAGEQRFEQSAFTAEI